MAWLTPRERVTAAMISGSAAAHGRLRRLSADEAVAEVTACLNERVPAERRSAVLAEAAAGYTPAATDRAEHARALAVLVAAGADVSEAEQVWRERRSSEPWRV
jgi:hypothetical protein